MTQVEFGMALIGLGNKILQEERSRKPVQRSAQTGRPTKQSGKILQGRYMGLLRHATRLDQKRAKKICAAKGLRNAVAWLRKHGQK